MDELVVECPNRSLGCTYTCQRLLLSAHVSESCQYVEVPCAEEQCGDTVLRKDLGLGGHQHRHPSVESDTGENPRNSKFELETTAEEVRPILA